MQHNGNASEEITAKEHNSPWGAGAKGGVEDRQIVKSLYTYTKPQPVHSCVHTLRVFIPTLLPEYAAPGLTSTFAWGNSSRASAAHLTWRL
eukprot:1225818-Pyramimonas_sp.AAC.2